MTRGAAGPGRSAWDAPWETVGSSSGQTETSVAQQSGTVTAAGGQLNTCPSTQGSVTRP